MTEIERINLEISKRKCEIAELENQKKEEEEKAKYTRWKPRMGEKYYFIKSNLTIGSEIWNGYIYNSSVYDAYNCFQTVEEAKSAANYILRDLKIFALKKLFPNLIITNDVCFAGRDTEIKKATEILNSWDKE